MSRIRWFALEMVCALALGRLLHISPCFRSPQGAEFALNTITVASPNGRRRRSADGDSSISLLQDVSEAFSCDTFAIGGTIDLNTSHSTNPVGRDYVVIPWDSGEGQGRKVSLPVGSNAKSQAAFQQLLEDCQAATFGRGSQDEARFSNAFIATA